MLPGEAEEVEARNVADAAAMTQTTVVAVDRQLDPRVVGPVARRPDHRVDLELAAVGEADRATLRADRARPHHDAVALHLARARPDQGVAAPRAPAEPRVDGLREQPELRQPPEEVAAEQALRQRRLARADREVNLAAAGQLLRDLEAGVAAAHDEHASFGQVRRSPVAGAVRLEDLGCEAAGEGRHDRRLEWPGCDDHRVGANRPAVCVEHEAVRVLAQRAHGRRELDRQLEMLRVPLEIGSDLVTGRVPVRVAGEREPRQRVVAARREQDERVPAIPPRGPDGVRGFEDHEPPLLLGQRTADRKPRLSGADYGDVVPHVVHDDPFLFGLRCRCDLFSTFAGGYVAQAASARPGKSRCEVGTGPFPSQRRWSKYART